MTFILNFLIFIQKLIYMKKIVFSSEWVDKLELYQLGMLTKLIDGYQDGKEFRSESFRLICARISQDKYFTGIKKFINMGILDKKIVHAGSEWKINWDLIRGEDEE